MDGEGLALSGIARQLQLNQSTAHHLLATMKQRGFVAQDEHSRAYRLGHRLIGLVTRHLAQTDLYSAGLGPIRDLRDLSGEMSLLNAYHGCQAESLIQMAGWRPIQCHRLLRHGETTLHSTATGKVLLACLPQQQLDTLLSSLTLTKFTANTIVDPDELLAELATIRGQGYALDHEENLNGVMCVAAPVFRNHGECVGSASVAFPASGRERVEELIELVVDAAAKVSRNLGHMTTPRGPVVVPAASSVASLPGPGRSEG